MTIRFFATSDVVASLLCVACFLKPIACGLRPSVAGIAAGLSWSFKMLAAGRDATLHLSFFLVFTMVPGFMLLVFANAMLLHAEKRTGLRSRLQQQLEGELSHCFHLYRD